MKAEVDRKDPASLKARLHSPPGSDATPIDVQFTTRIARMPDGTPIARGGGDAGKSLVELVGAIKAGDQASIRRLVDAETLAGLSADYRSDEENAAAILDVLRMWLPEKVEILGGQRVGDAAFLDVRGPMFDMPHHFAVKLKRVAGHWVLTETARLGPAS